MGEFSGGVMGVLEEFLCIMCKGGRFVLLFGVVVLLFLLEDSFFSYGIREVLLVVFG